MQKHFAVRDNAGCLFLYFLQFLVFSHRRQIGHDNMRLKLTYYVLFLNTGGSFDSMGLNTTLSAVLLNKKAIRPEAAAASLSSDWI